MALDADDINYCSFGMVQFQNDKKINPLQPCSVKAVFAYFNTL